MGGSSRSGIRPKIGGEAESAGKAHYFKDVNGRLTAVAGYIYKRDNMLFGVRRSGKRNKWDITVISTGEAAIDKTYRSKSDAVNEITSELVQRVRTQQARSSDTTLSQKKDINSHYQREDKRADDAAYMARLSDSKRAEVRSLANLYKRMAQV